MKRVILVLAMLLLPLTSYAEEWTWSDTAFQAVFLVLLEVDREQTQWSTEHSKTLDYELKTEQGWTYYRHYKTLEETNPILGKRPHSDEINIYAASVAVIHTGISYALRKYDVKVFGYDATRIWQSVTISVELGQVIKNHSIGVKTTF